MIHYFERILRFKTLEVWDIHIEKVVYRMFIFDENRPATRYDFHIEGEIPIFEEDLRSNLVTVTVYSENLVKEQHIESLSDFSRQATNHLAMAHCDVILSFYVESLDNVLDTFLKDRFGITYEEIPLNQLWHLNQD